MKLKINKLDKAIEIMKAFNACKEIGEMEKNSKI